MDTKLYHYVALRPDGTANAIWQYDHPPTEPPAGAVPLDSLTDQQWAAWIRNTAGWRWNAEAHALEEVPPRVVVPGSVSIVQACLVMHRTPSPSHQGKTLYDDVDGFITASNDLELKIAWTRATSLDRHGNFVNRVGQQLGLSDDQLDQLFIAASNIAV